MIAERSIRLLILLSRVRGFEVEKTRLTVIWTSGGLGSQRDCKTSWCLRRVGRPEMAQHLSLPFAKCATISARAMGSFGYEGQA